MGVSLRISFQLPRAQSSRIFHERSCHLLNDAEMNYEIPLGKKANREEIVNKNAWEAIGAD